MSSGKWRPFCLGLNVIMLKPIVIACIVDTYTENQPLILSINQYFFSKINIACYNFVSKNLLCDSNTLIETSNAETVNSACSVLLKQHYDDVITSAISSQITSLTIVCSTFYPGADQSKHQSSASLAFVWGIPRTNGQ